MQTEFGGSENTGRVAPLQTEGWLSDTGQVAQSAPDYSEAKQAFIGEYVNKAPRDRINLLMEHFGDFESFRDNYRELSFLMIL